MVRKGGCVWIGSPARAVVKGGEEVSPMAHDVGKLTEREREVLRLLARGYDIKSAAMELSVSTSAVSDRLRQARRKLGVSSSREAARISADHEADSTFDVHRFSGVQNASVPPQLVGRALFVRNGMAMTTLIAAAALISFVAIDHPMSKSDSVSHQPVECQTFASAHAKNGAPHSGRNVRFDTSVKGKEVASARPRTPKRKAEFCMTY